MKIVCFGDSNTYGYDPRSRFGGQYGPADRWVDVFSRLSGWNTVNAGENGREIPRHEWELDRVRLMLRNQNPDFLAVMLGTNDLLQGNTPDAAADRMAHFLTALPIHRDKLVLISPPGMVPGAWVDDPSLPERSVQLEQQYETLAGRLGIRFIKTGHWKIPITFDGVHFTEEGHRIFARKLWETLQTNPTEGIL